MTAVIWRGILIPFLGTALGAACVFFGKGGGGLLPAAALVDQGDGIVGNIVYGVHAAAVHVQNNVVAAEFILMNHCLLL